MSLSVISTLPPSPSVTAELLAPGEGVSAREGLGARGDNGSRDTPIALCREVMETTSDGST